MQRNVVLFEPSEELENLLEALSNMIVSDGLPLMEVRDSLLKKTITKALKLSSNRREACRKIQILPGSLYNFLKKEGEVALRNIPEMSPLGQ